MSFKRELETLINKHSMENGSNTPDFILAEYLMNCLKVFEIATKQRTAWYGTKSTFLDGEVERINRDLSNPSHTKPMEHP